MTPADAPSPQRHLAPDLAPDLEPDLEPAVRRWAAQAALFAARPARLDLLRLALPEDPAAPRRRVNVWRNHAVESVTGLAAPYLAHGRWQADWRLGPYDDSLAYDGWQPADAELLWLDGRRLAALPAAGRWPWLQARLAALRGLSAVPIVLATWFDVEADAAAAREVCAGLPGVHLADLGAACAEAGVPLLDPRSAHMAGTALAGPAQPVLARELACRWLPAVLLPPVKAIVLDLDHTLHAGVLGEDGAHGVTLTPAHAAFQRLLKGLHDEGVFLALVSRNEAADVQALFAARDDYPLRWDDFAVRQVGWGDKAAAVLAVAQALRIAPDAMVFVDDNPGELGQVVLAVPGLRTLRAEADAALTARALQYHPGLWRWTRTADDGKRLDDLLAASQRQALEAQAADPAAYFRSLRIRLVPSPAGPAQIDRLADLCVRTNQFNLSLQRSGAARLHTWSQRPDAGVMGVALSDRLSDSGTIAVVVAERHGERLVVEELCISCRALGRRLEDAIVVAALRAMPVFAGCTEVAFRVALGERNGPALDWLAGLLGQPDRPVPGLHGVPAARLRDLALDPALAVGQAD